MFKDTRFILYQKCKCTNRLYQSNTKLRLPSKSGEILKLRWDKIPTLRGNGWKYPFCQTMYVKRAGPTIGSQHSQHLCFQMFLLNVKQIFIKKMPHDSWLMIDLVFQHVESYLEKGQKGVEYIPTVDFLFRHNKPYYWLTHIWVPFGHNVIFRYEFC